MPGPASKKYKESALATGRRVQPSSFENRLALQDELDQHFTRLWLEFMEGLENRERLDQRMRRLALVGQFTVTRSQSALELPLRRLELLLQASELAPFGFEFFDLPGDLIADRAKLFAVLAGQSELLMQGCALGHELRPCLEQARLVGRHPHAVEVHEA